MCTITNLEVRLFCKTVLYSFYWHNFKLVCTQTRLKLVRIITKLKFGYVIFSSLEKVPIILHNF